MYLGLHIDFIRDDDNLGHTTGLPRLSHTAHLSTLSTIISIASS